MPVLHNITINDTDEMTKQILIKFVDKKKLGGVTCAFRFRLVLPFRET